MPELNDDILDTLVRRQLSRELDPQLGRAEQAFRRRHIQTLDEPSDGATLRLHPHVLPMPMPTMPAQPPRQWRDRPFGRFILLGGTALAASIAALMIAPSLFTSSSNVAPSGTGGTAQQMVTPQTVSQPVLHMVHSRTYDEGTTIIGGSDGQPLVPARKIRNVRVDQTQFYDPEHKARIEVTAPSEDVRFMEVDTY